jgi:hypothetical protein
MYHKAKEFDKDLFDANDPRGRAKAIQIITTYYPSLKVKENLDPYGIDLICYGKKDTESIPFYYVEVEVREAWNTSKFPWNTAHIPARKEKYFQKYDNVLYFQFNNKLESLLIFDGTVIRKMPIYTNKVKNEELFRYYEIPYPDGVLKRMWQLDKL